MVVVDVRNDIAGLRLVCCVELVVAELVCVVVNVGSC